MKTISVLIGILLFPSLMNAGILPVITTQPQSQAAIQGGNATLSVIATGATSFQWRYNGVDILGATNSSLQITNAQTTTNGYYMAVAKNDTGWTPSQLAWLSVSTG